MIVKSINKKDTEQLLKELDYFGTVLTSRAHDTIKAYQSLVEIQKHTIVKAMSKIRELTKDKTK